MQRPVPVDVAGFREAFRREHIPAGYSGLAHLAATTSVPLVGIALCVRALGASPPAAGEWLAIPLTFLFANFVEYAAHRGPMHFRIGHRLPVLGLALSQLFVRHTLRHHRFYTDEAMSIEAPRDVKVVLFPAWASALFLGVGILPAYALLRLVAPPSVPLLFAATGLGYYLLYEWLHLSYHLPPSSRIGRSPIIAALRRHHAAHHDPRRMTRWNFNITFPIADALLGTTFRPPA